MARFNEQIEPIYALLRETEDVNLSQDLLEPEPAEIPALKQRSASDYLLLINTYSPQSASRQSSRVPSWSSFTDHKGEFTSVNCNNGISDTGST